MSNINDRERLPSPLRDDPITAAIAGSLQELSADALAIVASTRAQFYPETATWGLRAWEDLVGITQTEGSPIDDRRAGVIAQLNSRRQINAAAIEQISTNLTGYAAKVTEHFGAYSFSLTLLGDTAGFTSIDLTLLDKTVGVIKPAHLRFILPHVKWCDIENRAMTWEDIETEFVTWENLELKHPVDVNQ